MLEKFNLRNILYIDWLTKLYIRDNKDKIFLFGDNLQRVGLGGQAAVCRYELNTIGIPTKKYPSNSKNSFFTDELYDTNTKYIDDAFNEIPDNITVVIPTDGLGTGLAQLPTKAPKTYEYILKKILELRSNQ